VRARARTSKRWVPRYFAYTLGKLQILELREEARGAT
jgi:hypothetical protein